MNFALFSQTAKKITKKTGNEIVGTGQCEVENPVILETVFHDANFLIKYCSSRFMAFCRLYSRAV